LALWEIINQITSTLGILLLANGEEVSIPNSCSSTFLHMVLVISPTPPTDAKQSIMDVKEEMMSSASEEDERVSTRSASDGDRSSRLSSPPSAADMSFTESPPTAGETEIPRSRSATMDSSYSVEQQQQQQETPSGSDARCKTDVDESPLSYQSLEERSHALARAAQLQEESTNAAEMYHTALYNVDPQAMLESAQAAASIVLLEGDGKQQPPHPARASPKLSSTRPKSGTALRRGKWTVEEEAYVARVIQDFNSGFLDAPAGTTLRTFLSEKLKCDPMRITKKFTGDACIGKRVFHPAVRTAHNSATIDTAQVRIVGLVSSLFTLDGYGSLALCLHCSRWMLTSLYWSIVFLLHTQAELDTLERRWRRRLELQQRESAKKAAASAVAAGRPEGHHPVTQTAAWLDRAKSALQEPPLLDAAAESLQYQIQEVQRLIYEGPVIQQTSADLPQMLDAPEEASRAGAVEVEPADKRLRTDEDAEALVGFIRSVRAAAGEEF
jgi:hypothetical protein